MMSRHLKKTVGALAATLIAIPVLHSSSVSAAPPTGLLDRLASYNSGSGEAGSEIVAFDARTAAMLVTNGAANRIDVVSLANPSAPVLLRSIELAPYGISVQSVATNRGRGVAVVAGALGGAVASPTVLDPGAAVFFDIATGAVLATAPTGVLPDSVAWSDDGETVVIANEGEPRCVTGPTRTPTKDPTLAENPEGSVTVIEVEDEDDDDDDDDDRDDARRRVPARLELEVTQVGFGGFNGQMAALQAAGVRVGTWPGSTVAQDLEPEYPTIVGDVAYVTLQENNTIARIDLERGRVTAISPLGGKNHAVVANAFDPSDRDGAASGGRPSVFNQVTAPVTGLYMPDAIASVRAKGRQYLLTANEGDTRTYFSGIDNAEVVGNECFADETRVGSLTLDPTAFPAGAALKANASLGRLKVTSAFPATKTGVGAYTSLWSFGGRSMSVWSSTGSLVWDSGSLFESIVNSRDGANWPNTNPASAGAPWATARYDDRSDDKGPEPEGIAVGRHGSRTYAFVGLERAGGIVMFDVTDPTAPVFRQWFAAAGDISPEGLTFVPASAAPGGQPLLLVAHEISGTTSVLRLDV